jgi:hypothetical protein
MMWHRQRVSERGATRRRSSKWRGLASCCAHHAPSRHALRTRCAGMYPACSAARMRRLRVQRVTASLARMRARSTSSSVRMQPRAYIRRGATRWSLSGVSHVRARARDASSFIHVCRCWCASTDDALHVLQVLARIRAPPRMLRRVRARHSCASKLGSPAAHAPLASLSAAASAALRAARQAALCAGQSCTWCSLQQ